jgi:predicted transcriptional regulator
VGTVKTTVTLDEELWKRFSILVIEKHGARKKNMVIEQLIKDYIEEHEWPLTLEAIWAFEEDILELRKSYKERVWKAHLSQPLGIPLHRYEGQIILDENALLLSGKDVKTEAPSEIFIAPQNITDLFLGWDDTLRRWKGTRAWIHPLRVKYEDEEKNTRTLYIYAKKMKGKIYGKENPTIHEKLREAWKIKSTEK